MGAGVVGGAGENDFFNDYVVIKYVHDGGFNLVMSSKQGNINAYSMNCDAQFIGEVVEVQGCQDHILYVLAMVVAHDGVVRLLVSWNLCPPRNRTDMCC